MGGGGQFERYLDMYSPLGYTVPYFEVAQDSILHKSKISQILCNVIVELSS